MFGIANNAVETLSLPDGFCLTEKQVDISSGTSLGELQDSFEWSYFWVQRSRNHVNVIRHYHIASEFVMHAIMLVERIADEVRHVARFEDAVSHPLIEPVFHTAHHLFGKTIEQFSRTRRRMISQPVGSKLA